MTNLSPSVLELLKTNFELTALKKLLNPRVLMEPLSIYMV